jgi:hypothetical protein
MQMCGILNEHIPHACVAGSSACALNLKDCVITGGGHVENVFLVVKCQACWPNDERRRITPVNIARGDLGRFLYRNAVLSIAAKGKTKFEPDGRDLSAITMGARRTPRCPNTRVE